MDNLFKRSSNIVCSPGVVLIYDNMYILDLSTNDAVYEPVIYWETPIQGFSSADFESKQVFYKSKDGTGIVASQQIS